MAALLASIAAGQVLDPAFAPIVRTNGEVYALLQQPDGKILVGGDFTYVNGASRPYLARVNADGTLDAAFAAAGGPSYYVESLALQGDGKILIAGGFSQVAGTERPNVARLNSDGSLDATFGTAQTVDATVRRVVLGPGGTVLVCGYFTTAGGLARNRVARLLADGSGDPAFDPGAGLDGPAEAMVVQPDGKIVVVGSFTTAGGVASKGIVRLQPGGGVDGSFAVGAGAEGWVGRVVLQGDGSVIIGGDFTAFNGAARTGLARLSATGALDASFAPAIGTYDAIVSLLVLPDGKILAGGWFPTISGVARRNLARLTSAGAVDTSFDAGADIDGGVESLARLADGTLMVGGEFSRIAGRDRNGLARLTADGGATATVSQVETPGTIFRVATQADGKVVIGGGFTSVNGTPAHRVARLLAEGGLDTSFGAEPGADDWVYAVAVASDGSILVGGSFTRLGGVARQGLARLKTDGSLDAAYAPAIDGPTSVSAIFPLPEGKALIGGSFTSIGGTSRGRFARLGATGALDAAFAAGAGCSGSVFAIAPQADGKLFVGGSFTTVDGVARPRVARLGTDGRLDPAWDPGGGDGQWVRDLAVQSDGKLIAGGSFTKFGGVTRQSVARFNTTGAIDASFQASVSNVPSVESLALQADGKVIIGYTDNFAVFGREALARLSSTGVLDPTFDAKLDKTATVRDVLLLADGTLLVAGEFTSVAGAARGSIARFLPGSGDPQWVPVASHAAGANKSQWRTDLGILVPPAVSALAAAPPDPGVTLRFYGSGGVTTKVVTVPIGRQTILTDVVGTTLGTSGTGTLSVHGDLPVIVTSRTYTALSPQAACYPGGTFGQEYGAWAPTATMQQGDAAWLAQLTESAAYRTNIALANTSGADAEVKVELLDGAGGPLGEYTDTVAAGARKQRDRPFFAIAGQTSMARGYARVTVVRGGGIIATASVIDNATNDPTTFAMLPIPGAALADAWVQVATSAGGAASSQWRTDLGVLNPGAVTVNARLRFFAKSGLVESTLRLAPRTQLIQTDVVRQFGVSSVGALQVVAPEPLVVTSRTYNKVASNAACFPNGTLGQGYPAYATAAALASGQSAWLPQLVHNAQYRTNILLTNSGATDATVTVELFDGAGSRLTTYSRTLAPGEYRQDSKPFEAIAGRTDIAAGFARVAVTAGSGVIASASVVDNVTQDPTTVLPVR